MKRLLLLTALVATSLTGLGAVPTAASGAESIQLTCFPHAPAELVYHDTFGAARSGGRRHTGTDILSPKRTEVLAAADGRVLTLDTASGAGYYVRLGHEGGWETWYMHLDNDSPGTDDGRGGPEAAYAAGLGVGDVVRAGEVIGYVGDSGNAEWTSSHTHFELHIGGGPVNPYPYLVDVEGRVGEMYEIVAGLLLTPPSLIDEVREGSVEWERLASAPGVQCLTNGLKDRIEHAFGELPGEGVLLAGVEAR